MSISNSSARIHRPSQVRLRPRLLPAPGDGGPAPALNESPESSDLRHGIPSSPTSPSQSLVSAFFGRSPRSVRRQSRTPTSTIATRGSGSPAPTSPSPALPRHRANTAATRGSDSTRHSPAPQPEPSSSRRAPADGQARTANQRPLKQPLAVTQPNTIAIDDQLGPLSPTTSTRTNARLGRMDPLSTAIAVPEEDVDEGSDDEGMVSGDEEIDLLEVVDPAVHTASTLAHIQNSLFLPMAFNRFGSPVIESADLNNSPSSNRNKPKSPNLETPSRSKIRRGSIVLIETGCQDENDHPIDHHIMEIVEHGQKQKLKRRVKGALAFLKTPLGVLFGIYGFMVVFWGAALVLILLKWIKIEPVKKYRIWIEICSQILNGLFTIPGIGLLPSRLMDWWNISIIIHYARIIWRRKGKENLADPNDILPIDIDRANAEKLVNQNNTTTTRTPIYEKRRRILSSTTTRGLKPCSKLEDERRILSDVEIVRLEDAQTKLCASQTWYRPHSSPTHYAFPIWGAFFILVCNLGNSLFQAGLCGVMWGLTYSRRPAWTTATFMAASFSCGLSSALLIWLVGRKTQKSKEVMERVEEILKNGNNNLGSPNHLGSSSQGLQVDQVEGLGIERA